MRRFLRSLAAPFVAVALLALLAGAALAQAGARVSAIEFRGNKTISSDTLRLSLRTKVGQALDESQLNEDVKTLYDLFASVEVEKAASGDQVKITFVVTESAIANDVVLNGVSGLGESEVRAVMDTTRGRPVAEFRVENDARKIERLYKMKGYHFVEVRTEITGGEGGRVVAFNVLEGPKVQVGSITFKGNAHVTNGKLLDVMATKDTGFLGLRGADFVEEQLVRDRNVLATYYRYEGFLNRQIGAADVTFSEDRKRAFITIEINEGAPFTTGEVTIIGADGYPGGAEALRPLLRVQKGKRFRGEDLSKSLNSLQAAYHDEGFFSVDVYDEEHAVGDTVDITFKIDEQSKVKVRDVLIVGNAITQDKVIRREALGLLPGAVLNQNEIRKTQDRLKGLGYFTDVRVEVVKAKTGDDPNQRDVRIEVDDRAKTGQVKFAVGASSDLGLLGSFTITKRNFDWRDWPERFADVFTGRAFTGAGQTFQLELSPGQNFSNYRLAFTEPWLFDKPIEFGWDLFFSKFTRFDYDVDRRGLDLTLGRRWTFEGKEQDAVFGITGTTRIEGVDLSNLDRKSAPTAFLAEGNNSLLAERFAFRVDRLDNGLNPEKGWFVQYTPEFGFGGDIRLFKNDLEGRRYWTVAKTEDERAHTFSVGSHVGFVSAQGSSVKADPNAFDEKFVPTYERYFAGGTSTVRGFAFGGAGPHGEGNPFLDQAPNGAFRHPVRLGEAARSVLDNDGDPLGGNVMFLVNAEYGFPVYQDLLRGVVFCDAGMVRDSTGSSHGLDEDVVAAVRRQLIATRTGRRARQLARSLEFDDGGSFFEDLRVSVGFGFRLKIPGLGTTPIALDFGFPVKKRDGDDTQVLSFSIAQNF
jgi:outer membrane protein insertion porin family